MCTLVKQPFSPTKKVKRKVGYGTGSISSVSQKGPEVKLKRRKLEEGEGGQEKTMNVDAESETTGA